MRFHARHGEVFEKMVEIAKKDRDDVVIVVPGTLARLVNNTHPRWFVT